MNNPFDYIGKERERREAEKLDDERRKEDERKAQALRAAEEREKQGNIDRQKDEAAKQYDGLVTEVLELLLQAIRPDLPAQTSDWHSDWKITKNRWNWSLGHGETYEYESGWERDTKRGDRYVWEVQIHLIFDSNYHPIRFDVFRQSHGAMKKKQSWSNEEWVPEPVEAGLSRMEIIEAIKTLYPLNSAG